MAQGILLKHYICRRLIPFLYSDISLLTICVYITCKYKPFIKDEPRSCQPCVTCQQFFDSLWALDIVSLVVLVVKVSRGLLLLFGTGKFEIGTEQMLWHLRASDINIVAHRFDLPQAGM